MLIPSGHLFLWVDKFHLCTGVLDWFKNTDLELVDLELDTVPGENLNI